MIATMSHPSFLHLLLAGACDMLLQTQWQKCLLPPLLDIAASLDVRLPQLLMLQLQPISLSISQMESFKEQQCIIVFVYLLCKLVTAAEKQCLNRVLQIQAFKPVLESKPMCLIPLLRTTPGL